MAGVVLLDEEGEEDDADTTKEAEGEGEGEAGEEEEEAMSPMGLLVALSKKPKHKSNLSTMTGQQHRKIKKPTLHRLP